MPVAAANECPLMPRTRSSAVGVAGPGLGMWPVGSRELCRPRTEVEGKLVTESDLSLRAPAQVAADLSDFLAVSSSVGREQIGKLWRRELVRHVYRPANS
jgi:hypothetical protein